MTPELVIDSATGALCMRLKLGEFELVREVPASLKTADEATIKAYLADCIPDMTTELRKMHRAKLKLVKDKADE